MKPTRRTMVKGTLAAAASIAAPALGQAQSPAPPASRTLKAVMHADLRVLDPVWTTANISSYHGGLVYDTLFEQTAGFEARPQMVERFAVSDDRKTWTFVLRDGLRFSDGSAVTSADCVASIRRWAARSGGGQHMFRRVTDTPVTDDKTFRLVLREPYPLMLDYLSNLAPSRCWIMRRKEAETNPSEQIKETVGSGPFVFNRDETKPGARYVYDRNPAYVPRNDPAEGSAGGKVVKLDRVVMENMPNEQTAMGALQAGEIDFYEVPPQDLIDQLEADPNIATGVLNKTGHMGWVRMNHMYAPFDKPEARRGLMQLINQADVMKAIFGTTSKRWQQCWALFGCGTPLENDANTDWLKAPDIAKARALFQAAGYDGRPVLVLHPSDHYFGNPASQLLVQWMRQAGVNAELVTSDWGGVLTRRAVKKPPAEGGWHVFTTTATGYGFADPIGLSGHAANGDSAWFGWPKDDLQEKLRDEWAAAQTLDERKAVARKLQENAWTYGHHAYLGQFFRVSAWRKTVKGIIGIPELVPFWNIEKTA
jgi:peptide/nickel transport system substrate-binding protein